MYWIFENEDRVWRFRGGRDFETISQFLNFLPRHSEEERYEFIRVWDFGPLELFRSKDILKKKLNKIQLQTLARKETGFEFALVIFCEFIALTVRKKMTLFR